MYGCCVWLLVGIIVMLVECVVWFFVSVRFGFVLLVGVLLFDLDWDDVLF